MNDPVPVEMHPMPEEYDAEKVFNAIFVMVRDQIQDEVSVASELTNKKVAKILGETLVEERVKARADQDRLQLAFDQFKLTVTTIVNNSNERIVELDAMVVEATQALTKANTEIARLEKENRELRVSGTLKKLPRKVRNAE
jgi:poly-D-alanine transfer protein DltD